MPSGCGHACSPLLRYASNQPPPVPPLATSALPLPLLPAVTAAKSGVRETKENRANYPKYKKAKREKVFEMPNINMLPVHIYIAHIYICIYIFYTIDIFIHIYSP